MGIKYWYDFLLFGMRNYKQTMINQIFSCDNLRQAEMASAIVDINNCHLTRGNPHSDLVHGIGNSTVLDMVQSTDTQTD